MTVLSVIALISSGCTPKAQETDLFATFSNPDDSYRPYVRWWWNGDKVTEKEILRELDLMKEAGIGGVEINPIRYPEGSDSIGIPSLEWLGDEWCKMIKVAIDGCRDKGIVSDMIVGSGWPFGSEYLAREQQLQLLTLETIDMKAGEHLTVAVDDVLARVKPQIHSVYPDPKKELVYLRLLPKTIKEFTPGINYDKLVGNDTIDLTAPQDGDYVLYCFVKLTGFMAVINGAPGAQGPVLNHFDKTAVNQYLTRLSDHLVPVIGKMGNGLRAAFCDSFETEGANWDANMMDEFRRRRGYDISPYLPYIMVKVGHMGNPVEEKYGSDIIWNDEFKDTIERVRNDYERTQIDVFREGFLEPYIKWCHKNGLKSRIQAYGRGLHPLESSMLLDIPEDESWFSISNGTEMPDYSYGSRGYSMINKFVCSGSLLSGNTVVSCEEMTNTGFVFNASMENIKLSGDMSNLSGVNHSVLHGFNYSPKEVPFPGWVRYGTYFNERNTWWRHIRMWMDYKARLSALFQNSTLQSDIAILPPLEDMWSKIGAQRDPFPTKMYPDYAHNLWEAVQQSGSSCDYISEKILEEGKVSGGSLIYGPRSYQTLMLMEVESLSPKAAARIAEFTADGGKLICIGKKPWKSHGLADAAKNDAAVVKCISGIEKSGKLLYADAPAGAPILPWYMDIMKKYDVKRNVIFSAPNKFLSQNHYKAGDKDIFFVVNYNLTSDCDQTIRFPGVDTDKTAWIWDATTGERFLLGEWQNGLKIHLETADAKVIVFDHDTEGEPYKPLIKASEPALVADGPWQLHFTHGVTGEQFDATLTQLADLSRNEDSRISAFAGDIDYKTVLDVEDPSASCILDAGQTNGSVVELFVNGKSAGIRWFGDRSFDVSGLLQKGRNDICFRITTVMGNYVKSLTDNPVALNWVWNQPVLPMGITGPVALYKAD